MAPANPAAIPRAGLPADELLKMRGRGRADFVTWPAAVTGEDEEGLLVDWEYEDGTVHLHRRKGRYRVAGFTGKDEGAVGE